MTSVKLPRAVHVACGIVLAACQSEVAVTCSDTEAPVDTDGDEAPDACAAVVDGGGEGDPCSLDHACADGLQCFFSTCKGADCELDVGECTSTQA